MNSPNKQGADPELKSSRVVGILGREQIVKDLKGIFSNHSLSDKGKEGEIYLYFKNNLSRMESIDLSTFPLDQKNIISNQLQVVVNSIAGQNLNDPRKKVLQRWFKDVKDLQLNSGKDSHRASITFSRSMKEIIPKIENIEPINPHLVMDFSQILLAEIIQDLIKFINKLLAQLKSETSTKSAIESQEITLFIQSWGKNLLENPETLFAGSTEKLKEIIIAPVNTNKTGVNTWLHELLELVKSNFVTGRSKGTNQSKVAYKILERMLQVIEELERSLEDKLQIMKELVADQNVHNLLIHGQNLGFMDQVLPLLNTYDFSINVQDLVNFFGEVVSSIKHGVDEQIYLDNSTYIKVLTMMLDMLNISENQQRNLLEELSSTSANEVPSRKEFIQASLIKSIPHMINAAIQLYLIHLMGSLRAIQPATHPLKPGRSSGGGSRR